MKERPIIVGFGIAGIFAALELIERGYEPLIFERGKCIEDRSGDIQNFIKKKDLNTESNIQFGEGGAGAYSDGKLFSRTHNSKYVQKVLNTFIKFGAPGNISRISKPHLGTDILCKIVKNIREHILSHGAEIHFNSKMTDLLISEEKACGIIVNGNQEYLSSHIYLATGHSARDIYKLAHKKGITLEQKPLLVGVRIEHSAETINRMRYGSKCTELTAKEGAAKYSLTYTDRKMGRGAYTFCMCPGGEIVNASSHDGMLVTNGMSYSKRDSVFSNSAIVVTCHTTDYPSTHPLAGIELQEKIEKKAFETAGRDWKAPAQNLLDFLSNKVSSRLNDNSFKMGTTPTDLKDIFPFFVYDTLLAAFNGWKKDYPEFISENAILIAPETRTSSPVRIKRTDDFNSITTNNLYPIGEGSGYTGGITSSAADAIKAVEKIHST